MKFFPYILLASALLSGCDFGEDKALDKISGGGSGASSKRYFTVSSVSATEGTAAVFTVAFNKPSDAAMTVPYATVDGTASSGADYTPTAGTLSFAAGETSKTISVPIIDDADVESSENFRLVFGSGENYDSGSSTQAALGTIVDNDYAKTLKIFSAANVEGGSLNFNVALSEASSHTVVVNWATADGTATTADSDYAAAGGTLTFAPGEVLKTVSVNTTGDSHFEENETFTVNLSGGSNYEASGSTLTATGTINNDDVQPTIYFTNASANEGSDVAFTIQLSNRSFQNVTVNYATADGTATTANSDYVAASGTITFLAGETAKPLAVTTTADPTYEPDETFSLTLSGGTNYTSSGSTLSGTGTITNDDSRPTIAITNASATEGSSMTFTATLSTASNDTITVSYASANGTATVADADYTAVSGTFTFNAGETTKTVNVNTTSDTFYEDNETFTVVLSGGSNYTAAGSTLTGTGTINNNDVVPTIAIASASATEGGTITFTATLSVRSYQTVTIDYASSDATATLADSDYPATTGTLTFNPGELTKNITVTTTADTKYEADETFTIALSGGANYNPAGSTLGATGTINNDDTKPTIAISDPAATEGGTLAFTVTLSAASAEVITVNYASSDGSATVADSDYAAVTGTLTFNAGETTKTINVLTTSDAVFEADEDLTMTLSGGANYTSAGSTLVGTGTVNNDDTRPTLAITNAAAVEGANVSFVVTLSAASAETVTVNYASADGTATTGDLDYTAVSGTLTFAAGETTKNISVATTADTYFEANENFTLALSGGGNYTAAGSTLNGTGTITNDDMAPTISIADAVATEGGTITFTATLSARSHQTVTVDYASSDGTATLADSDYPATTGTLTFAAGDLAKTITVGTTTDVKFEANETFTMTLSGGANYNPTGSTLSATGTINNDDTEPTIAIASASATEGNALTFAVTLAAASSEVITVNYASANGTATTGDSDYTAVSGTLTFAVGETSKNIVVNSSADTVFEADETFTVVLSGGANYTTVGSTLTGTGTINNDDGKPTIAIDNVSVNEGATLGFTVTLSAASTESVTVNYASADATATTGDLDYTAVSGTLTFNAGETSKTINVASTTDTHYEANETFTVVLSGGSNYTAAGSTLNGTGTITNEDAVPTVSIASASATEGGTITFTATLSARSYQAITIDYASSDGTATLADSDYTSTSGTLSFSAGDLTKDVTVATTTDTKYEANETFTITLSGGANYNPTGSTLSATGTINNDEALPTIAIANATNNEGSGVTFTVTQNRTSSSATTFSYTTTAGTATGGGTDFTNSAGTGTIAAGSTTTTITVPTVDDAVEESDEAFMVTMSSPSNASITTASATGTIVDTVLSYNFMGGTLPAQTTFTRASGGSYVDSTGVITAATTNVPRFDHDPTDCPAGVCVARGLLMEPAATNLILYSAQLDNAAWTKTGLRTVNADGGDAVTPDGVNTNAERIRENGVTSAHSISQAIGTAVTAGSLVQLSVYAKNYGTSPSNYLRLKVSSGANYIQGNFDLTGTNSPTTGSAGNGGGQLSAVAVDAGNGWKRLILSGVPTTSGTSLTVTFYLQGSFGGAESYFGDNASSLNLWGAQLEAGSTAPTSYIETTAAAATRSAEVLTSDLFTGFSGDFGDGTNFTMITDFSRPYYESGSTTAYPRVAELCDFSNCANNRISQEYVTSTARFGAESVVGGASQGGSLSNTMSPTAHTVYQLGTVKTGGSIQSFLNGSAITASSTITFPTASALYIGGSSADGTQLYGHLRKFTLRPRAVQSSQMLLLTND